MRLIGLLPVRSTIFDRDQLQGYETLEAVALNDDIWFDAFLSMFVSTVPLYELSEGSDYLVAFADTLFNDEALEVMDYVFAVWNLYGEVVEARFDVTEGMAYIPRELLINEVTDTLYIGEIQLQLMQVQRTNDANIYSTVEVLTDVELSASVFVDDDYEHHLEVAPANAFETVVTIQPNLRVDDLTVFINGFEVDHFEYDPQTGEVTVAQDAASMMTLRIAVADEEHEHLDSEVATAIASFEFPTIQPQAIPANLNMADVTLNAAFESTGVMTSTMPFRYFHANNPWSNYGHLAWYGPDYSCCT